MGAEEDEIKRLREERAKLSAQPTGVFDKELYDVGSRDDFASEIDVGMEEDADYDDRAADVGRKLASYTAPKALLNDGPRAAENDEGNVRTVDFAVSTRCLGLSRKIC